MLHGVNGKKLEPKVVVVMDAVGRQLIGQVDTVDVAELQDKRIIILKNPLMYVEQPDQGGRLNLNFVPLSNAQHIDQMPVRWTSFFEITASTLTNSYNEVLTKLSAARNGIQLATHVPPNLVRRN